MAEIALFGGSFDPPHLGHAYVVTRVLAIEPIDEVWLVPTHVHAFAKVLSPFERRVRMCEALAEIFGDRVRVSTIESEIARPRTPSRTVDTVSALRERYPQYEFAWVIGSDLRAQVDRWKDADRLRSMVRFIVVGREGYGTSASDRSVPIPDVSSSMIRARLASGEPVDHLVPSGVLRILQTQD